MSIFIGNVSNRSTDIKLKELFEQIGPCKVDLRVS